MIIDNREGEVIIYWIVDVAPFYGTTDINQVSENIFDFVTYTDKSDWISDMNTLGIKYEEQYDNDMITILDKGNVK